MFLHNVRALQRAVHSCGRQTSCVFGRMWLLRGELDFAPALPP
jgi:hypothetical protein